MRSSIRRNGRVLGDGFDGDQVRRGDGLPGRETPAGAGRRIPRGVDGRKARPSCVKSAMEHRVGIEPGEGRGTTPRECIRPVRSPPPPSVPAPPGERGGSRLPTNRPGGSPSVQAGDEFRPVLPHRRSRPPHRSLTWEFGPGLPLRHPMRLQEQPGHGGEERVVLGCCPPFPAPAALQPRCSGPPMALQHIRLFQAAPCGPGLL